MTLTLNVTKAGFTLDDLYNTIHMIRSRFSDFYCVNTFIQLVHTEFIKVVLTECSAFKSFSKMSQEQNYCTNFREKQVKEKKKREVSMKSRYETMA